MLPWFIFALSIGCPNLKIYSPNLKLFNMGLTNIKLCAKILHGVSAKRWKMSATIGDKRHQVFVSSKRHSTIWLQVWMKK